MDHQSYRSHNVICEDRTDGTILMRSGYVLGEPVASTNVWLNRWANECSEGVFWENAAGSGGKRLSTALHWNGRARWAHRFWGEG